MPGQINIRAIALDVLIEINENGAYSHQILRQVLDKYAYLDKRDRAFLTRLVEGTLERMIELDAILDSCSKVPVDKMKPVIRNILRMGVYQIKYMDSVPDSAACNESVRLAKKRGFNSLSGFVNGVLRGVIRCLPTWEYPDLNEEPVSYLSVKYSVPEWIVKEWFDHYGLDRTKQILQAFYCEHPITIRTNLTKCTPEALKERLKSEGVNVYGIPMPAEKHMYGKIKDYAFIIDGFDRLDNLPSYQEGWFYIQGLSSMMVSEFADPQRGEYVIDVCAAPGGKCTHIAEKLSLLGGGIVEARDISEEKVSYINDNITRMGLMKSGDAIKALPDGKAASDDDRQSYVSTAADITAVCKDATEYDKASEGKADLLICDLPCSGLGVMGHKTDIRYKMTPEKQADLVQLQRKILDTVAPYVKPGGRMIYSTCTVHRAENESNVEWFIGSHPEFVPDEQIQILPGEMGQDGFYMARLIRK